MDYIITVLEFFNDYSGIILPILLAAPLLFGFAYWLANPYRKQNKKLNACYKAICANPDRVTKYADKLPQDYRRQWRVVLNCGVKPSLAFEFVPKNKRLRLLWLFVLAAIVGCVYIAVFFVVQQSYAYLVFQGVFQLAFGLVLVVNRAVNRHQEKRARRIFARLASQLNRCVPIKGAAIEETVKQLRQLNRHEVNDAIVGRASELLRNKGLEANRTVEEQRKLNSALNGLLQAYSRKALNNKA